jgi:hypothetical protein
MILCCFLGWCCTSVRRIKTSFFVYLRSWHRRCRPVNDAALADGMESAPKRVTLSGQSSDVRRAEHGYRGLRVGVAED